jgi:hypothetical protein
LLLVVAACAAAPSDQAAARSDPEDVGALLRDRKVRAFFFAPPAEKAAVLRSHFTRCAARPGLTWQAWAMADGREIEAVRDAFGDDANDVLHTLD